MIRRNFLKMIALIPAVGCGQNQHSKIEQYQPLGEFPIYAAFKIKDVIGTTYVGFTDLQDALNYCVDVRNNRIQMWIDVWEPITIDKPLKCELPIHIDCHDQEITVMPNLSGSSGKMRFYRAQFDWRYYENTLL